MSIALQGCVRSCMRTFRAGVNCSCSRRLATPNGRKYDASPNNKSQLHSEKACKPPRLALTSVVRRAYIATLSRIIALRRLGASGFAMARCILIY
jgi:hypothetical protein